jgi:hypothetical protein
MGSPGSWPISKGGKRTIGFSACNGLNRASAMIIYVLGALAFTVPLMTLGLVALLRARPEDIPAIVTALARWGRRR